MEKKACIKKAEKQMKTGKRRKGTKPGRKRETKNIKQEAFRNQLSHIDVCVPAQSSEVSGGTKMSRPYTVAYRKRLGTKSEGVYISSQLRYISNSVDIALAEQYEIIK